MNDVLDLTIPIPWFMQRKSPAPLSSTALRPTLITGEGKAPPTTPGPVEKEAHEELENEENAAEEEE
jgi:hypothetical protein